MQSWVLGVVLGWVLGICTPIPLCPGLEKTRHCKAYKCDFCIPSFTIFLPNFEVPWLAECGRILKKGAILSVSLQVHRFPVGEHAEVSNAAHATNDNAAQRSVCRSPPQGHSLKAVYERLIGRAIPNQHRSLDNCKALLDIVCHYGEDPLDVVELCKKPFWVASLSTVDLSFELFCFAVWHGHKNECPFSWLHSLLSLSSDNFC